MLPHTIESKKLHIPSLDEITTVLQAGLSKNFKTVKVEVVTCPDLTQTPYNLVSPGLCGKPRIGEVGGVPYLMPEVHLDKLYSFDDIAQEMELPNAFIVGAGAGPHDYVGVNSEMISNLVTGSSPKNASRTVKINPTTNEYVLNKLPLEERRCALMQNLFACEGKPGKVLKVTAKQRIGQENFVTCMRKALENHFGDNPVGLGGAFRLVRGKAKCHVMPKFSDKPLICDSDVNNWLKFYEMEAPMVFMSVFVSHDPGLDLRVEHSHGHGENNGGHYHYDTTPEEVEYEGYFNVGEMIFRIDRPAATHNIGRN